jgi:outer membrane protein OmpA-like peptidoglycan-associated protein
MNACFRSLLAGVLAFLAIAAFAAERETLTFGQAVPPAEEVQTFLFPEAECENAAYQCLAVRPTTERSIGVDIRFHTGSADLTPQARAQLEGIGKVLAARGGKLNAGEIVIEGHTDARGSAEFNQKLSEQRAQSVVKHLVTVHGVSPTALKPVGRGKDHLKDPSRPDSEANRRVEMVRRVD